MSHTIIVFDDPVSSLDRSRRSHLAEIIREYSGRAAQTVVLSHDDVFVLDLFTRWGNDARYIQVSADQATGSKLTPVDVREFNKTDQRKRVEALKRYLDYDDAPVETRRGDIRLVLEDALRYKYWDELETAPNNPTTLGSIIDTLVDLHRLDADVVDELRYLNNASSGAHHAQPNVLMGSAPTRESILPFIRRALSVIKKV